VHTVRGFADYPDTFAVLQNNGFKAKGILMWSPDGQPFGFPVNNLDSWASYVRDIVTRYAGSVDSWEVWNEPPNFTADVSPASYAKIVQVAYNTAKAAVPGVRIGLAAKSVHIKWLAESIDAGAKGYYDYITLHPYEPAGLVRQGWEGEYMAIAPTVRKMLAEKDPARANVGSGRLLPVSSLPAGASPYGALNMSGNVWELADQVSPPGDGAFAHFTEIFKTLKLAPPTREEPWYMIRGQSFGAKEPLDPAGLYDSSTVPERGWANNIGFRCVKDAQ